MNTMKAMKGRYLTQRAELPIEERIFVKELTGINAEEHYREATDAEVAEWKEYKRKQEEELGLLNL